MADSPNRYTHVIDLTQKAQREIKQSQDIESFTEREDALPTSSLEGLPERVQSALSAAGWTSLMPVQEQSIPYLLAGREIIVQSRTGSGKTGAFLLPLFELLDTSLAETQALILTPTRELARQIYEEFERMKLATTETNDMRGALIYGGVRYAPQIKALKRGAHLVVGTPGRILDHLQKGNLSLNRLKVLIFDEADEMLSMGFYPDMRMLKRYLPRKRQSSMFSATMPPKVRALAREFLDAPTFLSLSTGQESVDTIDYRYYVVDAMDKDRALVRIIEMENPDSAIIFANTKRDVEYLATFLQNYGYNATEITGDLPQKAREEAMDRLRRGALRFLVATDVAARGIDISDLSHVFMYDVPQDPEYFIHRSGRTARAGKAGTAIVLSTYEDERSLVNVAGRYSVPIEKRDLPEPREVAERVGERLTAALEGLMRDKTNLERERMQRYVPLVETLAEEEPELLAMLIDEVYMRQLNAPPEGTLKAADAEPLEAPVDAAEDGEQEHYDQPRPDGGRRGRGRGRGGRRKKGGEGS